ncbi:unnamed protein product [Paramecium pentaurelia]|uniref:Secreted protein n=1 Tax=Paramecium pentaurelia TaxID=43138 RepID=A0A8S1VGY5_9CILI|nr:unnamed protein product [Paramecium pentaurelia]
MQFYFLWFTELVVLDVILGPNAYHQFIYNCFKKQITYGSKQKRLINSQRYLHNCLLLIIRFQVYEPIYSRKSGILKFCFVDIIIKLMQSFQGVQNVLSQYDGR